MRITVEELIVLEACEEAVEWFQETFPQETFPDGVQITSETLAQCTRDDWVCWLAGQKSAFYRYWCAGLAFRELYKVIPTEAIREFVNNVTFQNWHIAYAVAHAADNDCRAAARAAVANDAGAVRALHSSAIVAYYTANTVVCITCAADVATTVANAVYYATDAIYHANAAVNASQRLYAEMRVEAERVLCTL